jgi:hypothetical protein
MTSLIFKNLGKNRNVMGVAVLEGTPIITGAANPVRRAPFIFSPPP